MEKKRILKISLILICFTFLFGCSKEEKDNETTSSPNSTNNVQETTYNETTINDNYRTFYEIFVRSYYDGNGDGIGDLQGLTEKLDYLNDNDPSTDTDLGITGIWLMPIMQSATYHKYDVEDYYTIDDEYGTMEDFDKLLEECHKRNISVVIDFVFNHTSSRHEWFVKATDYIKNLKAGEVPSAEACEYFDYYQFEKDKGGTDKWHKVGKTDWYYYSQFGITMPDLNLTNEKVKSGIEEAAKFWLDKGVDGFRLDAVKHYFDGDDDKNVETLKWFQDYCDSVKADTYNVGEVWDTLGTINKYYTSGVMSIFNYALGSSAGKLVETTNTAGNGVAGKTLAQNMVKLQELFSASNPDYINSSFITNHDNPRAAGYVGYDEQKVKYLAALNLMMDGTSYIYYGDELGMTGSSKGDKNDPDYRTHMYWDVDGTKGITEDPKNVSQAQEHKFGTEVEQQKDKTSVLNYYKQAIKLRNTNPEIARGTIAVMTDITDGDIFATTRTYNDSTIEVIINNSTETKTITVDQSKHSYSKLAGSLSVNEEEVKLDGDKLTLPAYGIAVLR